LQPRDIVVIGGSAGAIAAAKTIVGNLPPDFSASIFIVVHISADSPGMLAELLSRNGPLRATHPLDKEQIRPGHIYVARPDHHLTIEDGKIRVLRGPRENRHRPAIDPLFRTAAREYGPRVVGIILSGLQDDGCAGLYAVRQRGGIAIVQDPKDALWKDMPGRAVDYANAQFILPARDIGAALVELATARESELAMAKRNSVSQKSNGRNKKRTGISSAPTEKPDVNENTAYSDDGEGTPSVFACPECHGVLWELRDNKMVRFRCRVGHSYGTESLSKELSMASEAALWAAVRALEEKAALQRRIADGMGFDRTTSSRFLDQSAADASNARLIRDMIFRRDAELELEGYEAEKKQAAEKRKTA
jgi:two-component system chemotaxis response regulator CheB